MGMVVTRAPKSQDWSLVNKLEPSPFRTESGSSQPQYRVSHICYRSQRGAQFEKAQLDDFCCLIQLKSIIQCSQQRLCSVLRYVFLLKDQNLYCEYCKWCDTVSWPDSTRYRVRCHPDKRVSNLRYSNHYRYFPDSWALYAAQFKRLI